MPVRRRKRLRLWCIRPRKATIISAELVENKTTGYAWAIEDSCNSLVESWKTTTTKLEKKKGMMGAPTGRKDYSFRVKGIGKGQVKFRNQRAWIKGDTSGNVFVININSAK
ncbi:MAG: protease inhibitor I42 family protein [Bacteroidota bacterium]